MHENYQNTLVIGGAGTGKAYSFIEPALLRADCSYVVNDMQGMLYRKYAAFLRGRGYEVKVLNLMDILSGDHYNPFNYIYDDHSIMKLTDCLLGTDSKRFSVKAEKCLLNACIACLLHYKSKAELNFLEVLKLLEDATHVDNPSWTSFGKIAFDALFELLLEEDPDSFACNQYMKFKQQPVMVQKNVMLALHSCLQNFLDKEIADMTLTDDMELSAFAYKKMALFIVTPLGDMSLNFIADMLKTQLIDTLVRYSDEYAKHSSFIYKENKVLKVFPADSEEKVKEANLQADQYLIHMQNGKVKHNKDTGKYEVLNDNNVVVHSYTEAKMAKQMLADYQNARVSHPSPCRKKHLPYHIRFLLDEFAFDKIPDIEEITAIAASCGFSMNFFVQSVDQLHDGYGTCADFLIGNCINIYFLGGGFFDAVTRQLFDRLVDVNGFAWNIPAEEYVRCTRGQLPITGEKANIDKIVKRLSKKEQKLLVEQAGSSTKHF